MRSMSLSHQLTKLRTLRALCLQLQNLVWRFQRKIRRTRSFSLLLIPHLPPTQEIKPLERLPTISSRSKN